jgi:hypothetical protein
MQKPYSEGSHTSAGVRNMKVKVDEALWSRCQRVFPNKKPTSLPCECGEVDPGITVKIVDGDKVKVTIDMDFVEGANGEEASWVPKGEIWIDDRIELEDMPFICYHEAAERRDMAKGMPYLKAHERANAAEKELRKRRE